MTTTHFPLPGERSAHPMTGIMPCKNKLLASSHITKPIFIMRPSSFLLPFLFLLLCSNLARGQQYFYCVQNQPTLLPFGDFNYYNPPNVTLQLVTGCGNTGGISVVQRSTGFLVTGTNIGMWSFCYRTVTGGNQYSANIEVQIQVTQSGILAALCDPDGCSISCYDDFEDFPAGGNTYYANVMPPISPEPFLNTSNGANTVDIFAQGENGNHYLSFRYSLLDDTRELVVFPLSESIPPGCSATFSFDAVATPRIPALNYNGVPTLGIYGLSGSTCTNGFPELNCIAGQTAICGGVEASCMTLGALGNTDTGIPLAVDVSFSGAPMAQFNGIEFSHYGPFTWTNESPNAVTHLLFLGRFQTLPTTDLTTLFNIDNFHIEKECNEKITVTPTVLEKCANGQAVVQYQVCLSSNENVAVPLVLQATTNAGTIVAGGGFNQSGSTNITLIPPNCTTVTLTINTANLQPDFLLNLNLTTSTPPCVDVDQEGGKVNFKLVDCTPPEPLTCSCTGQNTLNINASPNGTLYSVLEAQFNLDQNNDGILNLNDHHGCIAIAGRLIIDQNLTITDCPNIKMQPCSEIIVKSQRHLTMTQNTIKGCERMWRGITVESFGYLTFVNNEIQDAQQAITAYGSIFNGQPNGNNTSIIEVRQNRFIRNHIGVFVSGPQNGALAHMPFTRNFFIGNGTTNLLPPCDIGLANWNAMSGYAGVVSQGVNFTVGNATDNGITNSFSFLRNGAIGENCWLQVHHASFTDMVGEWITEGTIPAFASSLGIGVLTNSGFSTVNNSYFNGCGHGIYSNSGVLTAFKNDMPSVRRGIEVSTPFGFNLSENKDIVYKNKGIIGRDLQTGPISQWLKYAINKNTIRNLDQTTEEAESAIEIRNGNQPDLLNARMSDNRLFLDAPDNGIFITGVGKWTIDLNAIQYKPFNNIAPAAVGLSQNASGRNYLYHNTISDICVTPVSRAFNTSNSAENIFCCNITNGNRNAFRFFGACGSTAFRTADMMAHETCLEVSKSGTMGEQGGFNQSIGDFNNHRNWFNSTSGTALHLGTNQNIINASRFHVLSNLTPDFPEQVATPSVTNAGWFEDDGVGNLDCGNCFVPPLVPEGRGNEIEEGDRLVAGAGFGITTPGGRMLQWEGSRNLYQRMRRYTELRGKENSIDVFYTANTANKIGFFYLADSLVNNLSILKPYIATAIAQSIEQIGQAETAINTKLADLAAATNWADSIGIYRQADLILIGVKSSVESLVQFIQTAQNERNTKAQAALPNLLALGATDILEQNRKDILTVYAQTIGRGNHQFSPTQTAIIGAIAHQCPEEGGSAVYLAQALYQLVQAKHFDDDLLCNTNQRSSNDNKENVAAAFEFVLIPNPASNTVTIVMPSASSLADAQITLLNASGQVVLEQHAAIDASLVQLSLEGLSQGMYFCRIHTKAGVVTQKLIISR